MTPAEAMAELERTREALVEAARKHILAGNKADADRLYAAVLGWLEATDRLLDLLRDTN